MGGRIFSGPDQPRDLDENRRSYERNNHCANQIIGQKSDAAAEKSAWAFEQMKEFAMRIPDHSEDWS
jgi:hypothetical protein